MVSILGTRAALQQPDLGAVKGGATADLFLADTGRLADSAEVGGEVRRHLPGSLHQTSQSRAK
jgi:hypothetical protein